MRALDDALIDDVRALLAGFADSEASTLSVRMRDDIMLSISRHAITGGECRIICAPHVATVLQLPAIGSNAAIRLDLLGEEILVDLNERDVVEDLMVSVGDMVEYGTPLARIDAN